MNDSSRLKLGICVIVAECNMEVYINEAIKGNGPKAYPEHNSLDN